MQRVLVITLSLIWSFSYGQKICLYDAATNLPVPYASVYIYNGNEKIGGFSCDKEGCGSIRGRFYSHIVISSLGYETLTVVKENLRDKLLLSPHVYEMQEVIVNPNNPIKTISYDKRRFDYRYAFVMDSEFVLYFKNELHRPLSIKSFFFRVKKSRGKTILRIVMYKVVDPVLHDKVGDPLLNRDIIYTIEPETEGLVEIDLAPYDLILPADGAYVGTDTLQNLDENGEININTQYITRIESVTQDLNYFLLYNKYRESWRNIHNFNQEHFKSFARNSKDFGFPNFGLRVFIN